MSDEKNSRNLFDPNKSFFELKVCWVTLVIIIVVVVIISTSIVFNSNLVCDLSADGWNYFVSAFKVPLGVLALLIPVGALLAVNHRSEQTKKQIEVANYQNIFSNHYKHMEEFEKYCDSHTDKKITVIDDKRSLYNKIFPKSLKGDLLPNKSLLSKIEKDIKIIFRDLGKTKHSHHYKFYRKVNGIQEELYCVTSCYDDGSTSYGMCDGNQIGNLNKSCDVEKILKDIEIILRFR